MPSQDDRQLVVLRKSSVASSLRELTGWPLSRQCSSSQLAQVEGLTGEIWDNVPFGTGQFRTDKVAYHLRASKQARGEGPCSVQALRYKLGGTGGPGRDGQSVQAGR